MCTCPASQLGGALHFSTVRSGSSPPLHRGMWYQARAVHRVLLRVRARIRRVVGHICGSHLRSGCRKLAYYTLPQLRCGMAGKHQFRCVSYAAPAQPSPGGSSLGVIPNPAWEIPAFRAIRTTAIATAGHRISGRACLRIRSAHQFEYSTRHCISLPKAFDYRNFC